MWLRARLGPLRQDRAERFVLPHGFGRWLYYRAMSKAFDSEHQAVAAGRMAYRDALRRTRSSSYLLRRNVHRIEKGLIMPNRRDIFALEFIAETVAEFEAVVAARHSLPDMALTSELQWALDVLTRYFEVTSPDHPVLAPLRPRFAAAAALLDGQGRAEPRMPQDAAFTPFLRDLGKTPVEIGALQSLALRRRSVRSYRPDPVPRTMIDAALAVARQSPSACNRQAFSVLIFDDAEMARKVAAVPAGTKSFAAGVGHVAVLVGHLRAYPRERDRHAIYVDASLAAMGFIYGLEAQGLGSCAINWADEEPAESTITRMLSLAPDDRVIVMISFGWPQPDAPVPYSAKRDLDDFRQYNPGFDGSALDTLAHGA